MLRKLLPKLGGGPSSFWDAAVVEVDSMRRHDSAFMIAPKRLHYWDVASKAFVVLRIDEEFVTLERAKEAELAKTREEVAEASENNPFASAGRNVADYWADKL